MFDRRFRLGELLFELLARFSQTAARMSRLLMDNALVM
jgi:hypothetical protein